MALFRFLLIVMFGVLLAYTGVVMIHHGPSLFQVFFPAFLQRLHQAFGTEGEIPIWISLGRKGVGQTVGVN